MKAIGHLSILFCFLGMQSLGLPFVTAAETADSKPFEIYLSNPLAPEAGAHPYDVLPSTDANGIPNGYCMRLVTDVCLDRTCQILDVTLHWDLLGRYERIEIPKKRPLTKKDHQPFSREDYRTLGRILAHRNSLLTTYSLDWFEEKEYSETHDLDAVSGATSTEMNDLVVEGAAYTSWTLWHWVNGDAAQQLLEHTRSISTPENLRHWLTGSDPELVQYAVDVLTESGKAPDGQLLDALLAALKSADYQTTDVLIAYFERAVPDADLRVQILAGAVGEARQIPQREILKYLMTFSQLEPAVLEELGAQLPQMSYVGVHTTLSIFEQNKSVPDALNRFVDTLVESDNPFIVRRAKEYLRRKNS